MRIVLATVILISLAAPAASAEPGESNCVLRVTEKLPKLPQLTIVSFDFSQAVENRRRVIVSTRIGDRPIVFIYFCEMQGDFAIAYSYKGNPE